MDLGLDGDLCLQLVWRPPGEGCRGAWPVLLGEEALMRGSLWALEVYSRSCAQRSISDEHIEGVGMEPGDLWGLGTGGWLFKEGA